MKKLLSSLILCSVFSCSTSAENPEDSRLVFASTITGKVAILSADALFEENLVTRGHTATIGVAVMPDQKSFYYGNQDTNELEHLALNPDFSVELAASYPLADPMKAIERSLDGRILAITSESLEVENFTDKVHFFETGSEENPWLSEYLIPTQAPELNEDGSLTLPCPCPRPGAALSPDGQYAVVTHMHEHTAALMNPLKPEEATVVVLEPLDGSNPWLGPSAFPEFNWEGSIVGIPGMQAERLFLMSVVEPENPTHVDFPGTLPFDVAFSADNLKAYVATVDEVPVEGKEFLNAQIPSALHVVDLTSMTISESIPLDVATIHVTVPAEGDLIYLGSSFSRVMSYDLNDLLPAASINLSATPMPIMEIDL